MIVHIKSNCVRAYRGEGGQGHCVRVAYTGGRGSKIGKILRTYFMDGPLSMYHIPKYKRKVTVREWCI